jgi:hypothetical protein
VNYPTLKGGASIESTAASRTSGAVCRCKPARNTRASGSPFTGGSCNSTTGRDARLPCNTRRIPAFSFSFTTPGRSRESNRYINNMSRNIYSPLEHGISEIIPRFFRKFHEGGRNCPNSIFIEVMVLIQLPRERGGLLGELVKMMLKK